jgi:hypothetical protein
MATLLEDAVRALVGPAATVDLVSDDLDFMVNDAAGGNMDDAFELGVKAGEASMARQVSELLSS